MAKSKKKKIANAKKEIKVTELKSKTKIIREIKSIEPEAENKNQNLEQEISQMESSSLSEFISSGRITPTLHTGQEGAVRTENMGFGGGSKRNEEDKESVSYMGKSEQEKRNYSSSESTITSSGMDNNNLTNSRENGFNNTLQRGDFSANRMNTEVNEREEKKYELAEERVSSGLEVKRKRWAG